MSYYVVIIVAPPSFQMQITFSLFPKPKLFVMTTSVSRIFLLALVLSKAFANPLQQNEPSQQISYDIGVDASPDTSRELAALPGATANPGSLYATGDSLDQPGLAVTSWLVAESNGSPVAKSNDIWQQAVENHEHSIKAEITFQYKNEPEDSSGSVCKANTAARLFRRSPGTFQPCCFPIEIGLVLVERHPFCCEGGHVDTAPIRQNCILCMLTLFPFGKKFYPPPSSG